MKNSMKYVTILIVMIFAVLFFTMTRANASGISLTPQNGTNNTNTANATNTTNTPNNSLAVNSAEQKENLLRVNQINDADKDLPQTGETDIYIVSGIAVIAIAVGAFAFIKSRKYNI